MYSTFQCWWIILPLAYTDVSLFVLFIYADMENFQYFFLGGGGGEGQVLLSLKDMVMRGLSFYENS